MLLLAAVLAAVAAPALDGLSSVRLTVFDAYQLIWPRARESAPAVIVAVDDESLARHGQWPWPRSVLARLVARIAAGDPAAIGLDIIMPEPDRLSPERLPQLVPGLEPDLVERLRRRTGNDALLADALARTPAVLGIAGVDDPDASAGAGRRAPVRVHGGDPLPYLRHFRGALRSIEPLDAAAAGHGLLNVEPERGVVRRVPLVAAVGGQVLPGLGAEMLRVAAGASGYALWVSPGGVRALGPGDRPIPVQADGTVWIHFTRHDPARFVSAAAVLEGAADPEHFQRRLVLVAVTALGLADYQATPVRDRMSGAEIHAQLLEGIFDGRLPSRPAWLPWAETLLLAGGGLLLIVVVPAMRALHSVLVVLALTLGALVTGALLFVYAGLLADPLSPGLGLGVVFTMMLGVTLARVDRQRRALRRALQTQREAAARLTGELEAARRIQRGLLPSPDEAFPHEQRFELYACLEPARVVGGDLYDFFLLDGRRLFFLIGDVAGKGLPASLFMAVSKAIVRGAALGHGGDVAATLRAVNAELGRNNPEALFVTALIGVLDVATGELQCGGAGHDSPYLRARGPSPLRRLQIDGGPPLGVLDGFPYAATSWRLEPGDALCLLTDGVTDAVGAAGEVYGRPRLEAVLAAPAMGAGAADVGEALRADVTRFVAGAEPADDLAILVIRWTGVTGP